MLLKKQRYIKLQLPGCSDYNKESEQLPCGCAAVETYVRGIVLVIKKYDKPSQLFTDRIRSCSERKTLKTKEVASTQSTTGWSWEARSIAKNVSLWNPNLLRNHFLFGDKLLTIRSIVDIREPIFANSSLGKTRSSPIFNVLLPLQVVNDIGSLPIPIDLHLSTTALFRFCLPNRLTYKQLL